MERPAGRRDQPAGEIRRMSETEVPAQKSKTRGRRVLRLVLFLLVIGVIAGGSLTIWVRSARFNRMVREAIETSLRDYGLRGEVGGFGFTLWPATASLRNLRIVGERGGREIATIERLDLEAGWRGLSGGNGGRRVVLKRLRIAGIRFRVEIDESGRGNFDGVERAGGPAGNLAIDYSQMEIEVGNGEIEFVDRRLGFGVGLGGVSISGRVDGEERVRFRLTAGSGEFDQEGRMSPIEQLAAEGVAGSGGLELNRFELKSGIAGMEADGRISSWAPLRYEFGIHGTSRLAEVARLFAPGVGMAGEAICHCRVKGEEAAFEVTGSASTGRLSLGEAILDSVEIPGALFRYRGERVEFGGESVSARSARFGKLLFGKAMIERPRGSITDNGAIITSPVAVISGIDWPGSHLGRLQLAKLKANVAGRSPILEADAELADGVIAGAGIRTARAAAKLDEERLRLSGVTALAGDGHITADIDIPLEDERRYQIVGSFTDIPTTYLLKLVDIGDLPVVGTVSGETRIDWRGGDAGSLAGMATAKFAGGVPDARGGMAIDGGLRLDAADGVFTLSGCELRTAATRATAMGTIAVAGASDLRLRLSATRGAEIIEIARAIRPLQSSIDQFAPDLPGSLEFEGRIGGELNEPRLEGRLRADQVTLRGNPAGAVDGRISLDRSRIGVSDGRLAAVDGGLSRFEFSIPLSPEATDGWFNGEIDHLPVRLTLATVGITVDDNLIAGMLSGNLQLSGLPGKASGTVDLQLIDGTVLDQPARETQARLLFVSGTAQLESLAVRLPQATLSASGWWNIAERSFSLSGEARRIPLAEISEMLATPRLLLAGEIESRFQLHGRLVNSELDWSQSSLSLSLATSGLRINERTAADYRLVASTSAGGVLRATLNQRNAAESDLLIATVALRERALPLTLDGQLRNQDLAPLLALIAPEKAAGAGGLLSGSIHLAGPIRDHRDRLSAEQIAGEMRIEALRLTMDRYAIRLESPAVINLTGATITAPSVRLIGDGIDLNFAGSLGLIEEAPVDFTLRAKLILDELPALDESISLFGSLAIEAQARGNVRQPNLTGAADMRNLGISSRELPFFLTGGNGLVTLAGNRLEIAGFRANANDGRLEANGFVELDGLRPDRWKIDFTAERAEVYYRELSATLSAGMTLEGTKQGQRLTGTINASRLEYDARIDLDNLIGGGVNGAAPDFGIDFGGARGSAGIPTRLDLRLEARDAVVLRSEQINALGTAYLNVSGPSRDPAITGRLESESGSVRFRGQRYEITRATLDLLPGSARALVNLIAESEFRGYRVSLNLAGEIDAIETTLRSEPPLSRDEIVALITTGRTDAGSLTSRDPLRSGVGAAASFLTSGLISRPTEQLLGISRFQIDPIIRPNANPAARLTVGQQLSRNLYVSYATNLATEQDQTAIGEYTITNRFSGLATYTQGGSSTRQGLAENVFTIELRGRQRFSLGFLPDSRPPVAGGTIPTASLEPAALAKVEVERPENLRLSNRKLRELLPLLSQRFSRSLARLGERRLREYLQEQGYFFADVSFRCEPVDCAGSPTVFYEIEPNRSYELGEIRIEGTTSLLPRELAGELRSEKASRVGGIPFLRDLPLIGGYVRGLTSNERLRSDAETIRRRLVDQGYLEARVRPRLAVRPDDDALLLIFNVEEGALSRVGEVVISGNRHVPLATLRTAVPLSAGQAYSPTAARAAAQQLRQLCVERGYLEAVAELDVSADAEGRLRLDYRVSEGVKAVVSEIEITGTTRTGSQWVKRYFDFHAGDLLTPTRLRTTQTALYATNAFREVNLRVSPVGGDDGSAHRVTVNLTEAKPLLFVYGLGYSTDDGARGSIELVNTNLRGSLDSVSMRLRASRREQISQLTFVDLRPFGWKMPATVSVFYNRSANLRTFVQRRILDSDNQTGVSEDGKGFGLARFGTFVQTERRLDTRTSIRFRYTFERATLFGIDEQEFRGSEVSRNERSIRLGAISAGISRDTRDNVLNPTKGQLISADHSLASQLLGGGEAFNKFFATFQRYRTIPPGHPLGGTTLAFSARIGLAGVYRVTDRNGDKVISESERRLPISERFFSGGATTLRGFRFETAGPQEILEPRPGRSCNLAVRPCELPTLVPIGGDALAILNFELRYPLTSQLRLAPFYDAGNVLRRVTDFSFRNLTNTVGVGLRFNTPIGPVGVDYGFLIDPPAYTTLNGAVIRQPRGVFHVRLGQSF